MGSPNGLWTAVSGGMAQSQNLDVIANNLANAGTVGFRKDAPVFKEYLTAAEQPLTPPIDIPRSTFKDSDFYHFDGREHALVNVDRMHTDVSAGTMRATSAPFDFAIEGPGLFAMRTPAGIRFTRAGDFKVNSRGALVTTDGFPVLGLSSQAIANQAAQKAAQAAGGAAPPGGAPIQNPFTQQSVPAGEQPLLAPIELQDAIAGGHKLHVTPEGAIYAGDQLVGTLALAEFADARRLKKATSTSYENPDPANVPRVADASRVHQGFLESSNVNPVSELVDLLKANRLYESNMRAIKAYNDMSAKEANEVGKL